jgi:hypothetical protein
VINAIADGTVTRWPPPIGVLFTIENNNAGIMAMTMNGIANNEGPRPGAGRRAGGNRP